jgi:hypothetical protein
MDGFISAAETFYHGDYDKQNHVLNNDDKQKLVYTTKGVQISHSY